MPDIPPVDEEKHKKRMEAIQMELAQLNEEIAKLQPKVAELGDAEESKVIIQPSGSGTDLEPTFVECTAAGLVFLEEKRPPTAERRTWPRRGLRGVARPYRQAIKGIDLSRP